MEKIVKIIPGRSCDDCALCCMVMGIEKLKKPKGEWCPHCLTKKSCGIYADRPSECRDFHCGYLTLSSIGEEWKPSRSKIILVQDMGGNRVTAHVDPKRPDAWKKEPFYSTLKNWSNAAIPHGGHVLVCVGHRTYRIFPDRDEDMGVIGAD